MALPLSGWAFYDDGTPVDGAVVEVYNQTPTLIATDNTTADGFWAFDDAIGAPHQASLTDGVVYDVKITNGGIVRWIKGAEKHQTASVVYFAVPYLDFVEQSSAPGAGLAGNSRMYVKTADHKVYVKDSGGTEKIVGVDAYQSLVFTIQQIDGSGTVGAGVTTVYSNPAANITITLPNPTTTGYPITVVNEATSHTVTLAATGGSTIIGGSPNLTTGAIQNGVLNGNDSLTYQSDGTNWRAVG